MKSSFHVSFLPTHALLLLATGLLLANTANAAGGSFRKFTFSTLAGMPSVGSTDGAGNAARFNGASGIVADRQGNLYVADFFNLTIRRIAPDGTVSTVAGATGVAGTTDGPGLSSRFSGPGPLAIDAQGNVFVGDVDTVRRLGTDGQIGTVGSPFSFYGKKDYLASLAVDPTGTLMVGAAVDSSSFPNTLFQLAAAGTATVDPRFRGTAVSGLAFSPGGQLFYSDQVLSAIYSLGSGGSSLAAGMPNVVGSTDGPAGAATFNFPQGLVVAPDGTIFIADVNNGTIRALSPSGQVSTVAGVAGQLGYADGAGANARFSAPTSLALDPAGNLWVSDNNAIRRISPSGQVTTVAGISYAQSAGSTNATGAAARFLQPRGIAVDLSGNLYVADTGNCTIRKITPEGLVSTLAGTTGVAGHLDGSVGAALFSYPTDVAVDSSYAVYVLDGDSTVRKITNAGVLTGVGTVSTIAGQSGKTGYVDGPADQALFAMPLSLAADSSGNVYVGEAGSTALTPSPYPNGTTARLRKISTSGQVSTIAAFTASFQSNSTPTGVAVDVSGNLYVCDGATNRVLVSSTSGTVTAYDTSGTLPYPDRIAVDRMGGVFLTQLNGYAIGQLTPDAQVSIIAGQRSASGSADGQGTDARFGALGGIAADVAGNLYVTCESPGSNTIRKGALSSVLVITGQPQSQTVTAGTSATFSVTANAVPAPTYQWYFNGNALGNQTGSSLVISNVQSGNAGNYSVMVTNSLGYVTSDNAVLTVNPAPPSGGGGGGSPSPAFLAILGALLLGRLVCKSRARAGT